LNFRDNFGDKFFDRLITSSVYNYIQYFQYFIIF
jgi:hypothetical protein